MSPKHYLLPLFVDPEKYVILHPACMIWTIRITLGRKWLIWWKFRDHNPIFVGMFKQAGNCYSHFNRWFQDPKNSPLLFSLPWHAAVLQNQCDHLKMKQYQFLIFWREKLHLRAEQKNGKEEKHRKQVSNTPDIYSFFWNSQNKQKAEREKCIFRFCLLFSFSSWPQGQWMDTYYWILLHPQHNNSTVYTHNTKTAQSTPTTLRQHRLHPQY